MTENIQISENELAAFCQKHGVMRLSLFGSVLRKDFTQDSDIDILIEFYPESRATFFDLLHAEYDLKKLIGSKHNLDVLTPGALHPFIRDEIINTRKVVYEAG